MEPTQDAAVRVLNSLIETTLDSAHGYEAVAEIAREGKLKSMFAGRSRRRMELARQLQQEVRTFGGASEDGQSGPGRARDRFVDLKNAVEAGHDEKAIIDEVERGEDVIRARLRQALEDKELPATVREVVSRAYESVCVDHDEISRLQHTTH
jgi:uncharacterized protein (TIGR02284 family)